jgi:hypothetical protein
MVSEGAKHVRSGTRRRPSEALIWPLLHHSAGSAGKAVTGTTDGLRSNGETVSCTVFQRGICAGAPTLPVSAPMAPVHVDQQRARLNCLQEHSFILTPQISHPIGRRRLIIRGQEQTRRTWHGGTAPPQPRLTLTRFVRGSRSGSRQGPTAGLRRLLYHNHRHKLLGKRVTCVSRLRVYLLACCFQPHNMM